jgi:creatinine amidohydrolase/Fe(II)-dependent formamide hydrolase-like protein
MRASRGMGDIAPSKMPKGVKKARRDNTDFTQYAEGGKVKKNWIQDAIKKPGALREELGAKKGEPIPAKKLASAAKKSGVVGKRARLAETLKGLKK